MVFKYLQVGLNSTVVTSLCVQLAALGREDYGLMLTSDGEGLECTGKRVSKKKGKNASAL